MISLTTKTQMKRERDYRYTSTFRLYKKPKKSIKRYVFNNLDPLFEKELMFIIKEIHGISNDIEINYNYIYSKLERLNSLFLEPFQSWT